MNTNIALKDNNVLMFDNPIKAQQELGKLLQTLESVSWELQVKLIVEAIGLPLTEVLLDRSSKVPRGSLAGRLGFNDIEGFVVEKNGLSLPWLQWDKMIVAYRLKEFYGIYLAEIKDVIAEYEDVTKILGHIPANKFEYNRAKDHHFVAYKETSEARHKIEIKDLQDKLASTQSSEREVRMHLSESINRISEMRSKHELELAAIERKLEAAKIASQNELADKLEHQRNEMIKNHDALIKVINAEHSAKIEQVESERAELIKKYNSSNFVPIDIHESVKQQLSNEVSSKNDIFNRLTEANERLESMKAMAGASESEILRLKKIIAEQTTRLDVLANLVKSQFGDIDVHTIAILKDEIKKLKGYVDEFRSQKDKYKDKSLQIAARSEKLKEKISKLSAIIEEHESKKLSSIFGRMIKSIISTVSVGVAEKSTVKA